MGAYRITVGAVQARFSALGSLTHIGHPAQIRNRPTVFRLEGKFQEGFWHLHLGKLEICFDPDEAEREFDLATQTLKLYNRFRGPGGWYGVDLERTYRLDQGLVRCDFRLHSYAPKDADAAVTSAVPVMRLRYYTGVNSWTNYSSEWAHRPYPNTLRCEANFFYGCAVSPDDDIVGHITTTPADSWQVLYEDHGMQRIYSYAIDFVNRLDPLPDRITPQCVTLTTGNPDYAGTFYVGIFSSRETFYQTVVDLTGATLLNPSSCSGRAGRRLSIPVIRPQGKNTVVSIREEKTGSVLRHGPLDSGTLDINLPEKAGRLAVTLDSGNRSTTSMFWGHGPWQDTLRVAAHYACDQKIPSGYNAESILAIVTIAQAAGLLHDAECATRVIAFLNGIYDKYYDRKTGRHNMLPNRLQNYGSLLDAIRVYQRCLQSDAFLEEGILHARQLMALQGPDGHFRNHHGIYDNVIHPVQSLHAFGEHIRAMGRQAEADAIAESVSRAYERLVFDGSDTQTEGSDHFEDGMTACAGFQIAALAPYFENEDRAVAIAEEIAYRRRALLCRIPDSRCFGSTLRHWEGYWAMGLGECMLGGHGWNCWHASLTHALFLRTGKWDYLVDCYSTLCNCLQAIDLDAKTFHFGFAVDPTWHDYFGLGCARKGEIYVPVPDEIKVASEQHQVFLTLDDSFYRNVYLRLRAGGVVDILNGRILKSESAHLLIESEALDLKSVVVVADKSALAIPEIAVQGQRGWELKRIASAK